MNLKL
jgi:hypothetical protein